MVPSKAVWDTVFMRRVKKKRKDGFPPIVIRGPQARNKAGVSVNEAVENYAVSYQT